MLHVQWQRWPPPPLHHRIICYYIYIIFYHFHLSSFMIIIHPSRIAGLAIKYASFIVMRNIFFHLVVQGTHSAELSRSKRWNTAMNSSYSLLLKPSRTWILKANQTWNWLCLKMNMNEPSVSSFEKNVTSKLKHWFYVFVLYPTNKQISDDWSPRVSCIMALNSSRFKVPSPLVSTSSMTSSKDRKQSFDPKDHKSVRLIRMIHNHS